MTRWLLPLLGVLALTAVLVVGLSRAGGGDADPAGEPGAAAARFDLAAARRRLAGAPGPLAALHERASALLPGGKNAFAAQLAQLAGHPVVINKWASWCAPCRAELPVFQQVGTTRGKEVAFLGLNAADSARPAERFLRRFPLPFPSFVDPDEQIAREIGAPANYPVTIFVDERGARAFIHQGAYRSVAALESDIERYLGPA